MSEQQELAMGAEADPQIIAQYGLYADSSMQRMINAMGQKMAGISHRPNIQYHFRVLDSDVLNAFATPGGYVYFTRGIIAHFNNEAQFAGVLGHEIGHITARHTVSQQTKQTFGQLGIIAASIYNPNLGQLAQQGGQLLFLKFDRAAETQSDELGVQYSSSIGFDAHEMAKFFNTLKRQGEKSGQSLPEFLSTHPDPGNRFNTVNRLATEWQAAHPGQGKTINRNDYLNRINGIVYGEDPKQGFRQNGVFYHPDLRIQFNTPNGWQYQNTPAQVQFAEPNGQAVMIFMGSQAKSLQEAAQQLAQQAKLQVEQSNQTTVNGLPAYYLVGTQVQQDPQTGQAVAGAKVLAYFIQHNNTIYTFVGLSSPQNFNAYGQVFLNSIQSFKNLTDPAIINIKPERVVIKTAPSDMTLAQALAAYKMPTSLYEELAILNGLQQSDKLPKGAMFKILQRQ